MAQSGSVEIIPGKQFVAHENVTLTKLNQLGRPIGRVAEGSIGIRELNPTAVKSLVPQVARNHLFNGNFDVWQRGGFLSLSGLPPNLGGSTNYEFGPDRWGLGTPAGGSHRQIYRGDFVTGQTDVPGAPNYYMIWKQLTAEPGLCLRQPIENVRTLAGKSAVLSFWARAAAPTSVTLQLTQDFGGSVGPPHVQRVIAAASGGEASVGTVWQKFIAKFNVPDLAGYTQTEYSALIVQFLLRNAVFEIHFAQVQLEEGIQETTFEMLSLQYEIERCQRYYETSAGIMGGDDTRTLSIPVDLTAITAAGDVLTELILGYPFKILDWSFFVTKPVAVAGKAVTLNLEIESTNVGAGTLALTSAALNLLGKEINASDITGADTGSATAKLSVEASAVTAFTDGSGVLLIRIQNIGVPVPCYYFNVRKYQPPTLTVLPGYTGSGVAFTPLLDVGYYQSAPNSERSVFYLAAEAEIKY